MSRTLYVVRFKELPSGNEKCFHVLANKPEDAAKRCKKKGAIILGVQKA